MLAARGLDEARSSPDFWFLKFVPWLRFAPRMAFLPLRIPCSRLAAWMKLVLVEACSSHSSGETWSPCSPLAKKVASSLVGAVESCIRIAFVFEKQEQLPRMVGRVVRRLGALLLRRHCTKCSAFEFAVAETMVRVVAECIGAPRLSSCPVWLHA